MRVVTGGLFLLSECLLHSSQPCRWYRWLPLVSPIDADGAGVPDETPEGISLVVVETNRLEVFGVRGSDVLEGAGRCII